ncbi:hypothetical protein BsWGS_17688 [Bradybaena similaris]
MSKKTAQKTSTAKLTVDRRLVAATTMTIVTARRSATTSTPSPPPPLHQDVELTPTAVRNVDRRVVAATTKTTATAGRHAAPTDAFYTAQLEMDSSTQLSSDVLPQMIDRSSIQSSEATCQALWRFKVKAHNPSPICVN